MFLFERAAAAMPKKIFDMGVFMADVRPDCPPFLLEISG
jgi:hypothetical protein